MSRHAAMALSVVGIAAASVLTVAVTGNVNGLWGLASIIILVHLFDKDSRGGIL